MRAGACAVQQTLTTEAASVLKHSLSLARRRGHAQVTPLHVAFTLLSSRASILKRACLKSQPHQNPHPIHSRALELCFNVSLNRLPNTPGPLLHGQPSLSNALIAALKRAQAHQRRGCIEQQQQQPLLTVKVELEQLIISILDDPSVSRVMREAGFSSTTVKNNVEDSSSNSPSVFQCYSSSGGVFSSPSSPPENHHRDMIINNSSATFWPTHFMTRSSEQNPVFFSPQNKKPASSFGYITDSSSAASMKEDVKLVLECMLRKKRNNTVIVGDSMALTENIVVELIGRIERGDVPDELKSAHLIKFQFAPVALSFMKREDVEMNLADLKRKVDSLVSGGRGAIIYAGDLKWTVETSFGEKVIGGFNPVEYLVAEIGRLVSDYSNNINRSSVWLMATASYQTYMKCRMRQPSLEILWGLQAVLVPSGGLGLTLQSTSFHDSRRMFSPKTAQLLDTKTFPGKDQEIGEKITCCGECISNYEKEAQLIGSGQKKLLPSWLQPQDAEVSQKEDLIDLRRKWNRLCHSLHQGRQNHQYMASSSSKKPSYFSRSLSYNSSSSWLPNKNSTFPDSSSISFADLALKNNQSYNAAPLERQQSSTIEFNFDGGSQHYQTQSPSLNSLRNENKEDKLTLALGSSLFSDSGKLVEQKGNNSMMDRGCIGRILRENVPWQSEAIPSILEALMDTKSSKKETWLLIEGNDTIGKRRLAHSIAESLYGSADLVFHMNMKKRDIEDTICSELLAKALRNHEKLVVLVEEFDTTDIRRFLADGFETRCFEETSKRDGKIGQAVFILTKGNSISSEDRRKNQLSVIPMVLKINESIPSIKTTPHSNIKRKAEWDIPTKIKSPRMEGKEDASSVADHGTTRREFSRQSSFNTLDLNLKADEYGDEVSEKPGEVSPISSDLTRETNSADMQSSQGFLESIKNTFIFNRNATRDREMKDFFLSKIKRSFEEVYGGTRVVNFDVDVGVLEEVCIGSAFILNSLFEKWLQDVFQTSMHTVKLEGKGGIHIRLCLDINCEKTLQDGFMGSILPKNIQVCSIE